MAKLFIEDIDKKDLTSSLVILRCDLNVPLSQGKITNDSRIRASLDTIRYLCEQKRARLVLVSHLGRPKGKIIEELRLAPVAQRLKELLADTTIAVHYATDCIGLQAKKMITELKAGELGLLENLRFHQEETDNDADFSRLLSHNADYFINDAFGTAHRAHASTSGITKHIKKSAAGYLMHKEISYLDKISDKPQKPFIALCGGAKVSDKIQLLHTFLQLTDHILIGGMMAFPFLQAMGHTTGRCSITEEKTKLAQSILSQADGKIELPKDFITSPDFDFETKQVGELSIAAYDQIPENEHALDIGPKTIEHFTTFFTDARTIFWNGPMGVFEIEKTARGTLAMAQALANTKANHTTTVIGGGDSAAAIMKSGLEQKISHISTGGGATLSYLVDPQLPGIASLTDKV